MKKKYLNTGVALVVLAALWGAFTYYGKRKSREATESAKKPEAKSEEKILALDPKHIQSFTVTPHAGKPFTCQREGATWTIVEPRKLPGDQSALSSFLTSLTTATIDEVVDPHPGNLKDFGLDPPVSTVKVLADIQPRESTLMLGDETPTSDGLYAQVAGNPRVVLLPSYLKSSLDKNLFDLRDRRATTLDADQIQRIEVESNGKHWTLTKNPEGVWDLMLPPPVRADLASVDGLVNQLRSLTMQSVVAEDKTKLAQYGFGSPSLRLKLSSPAGQQTLVLGRKVKEKDVERYDTMNSALKPIFTLSADFLSQFQKDPADLRDKDLFSFPTYDAKRLEVETPKGHRVFEKQKDKWKQTLPSAKDENTDKMEAFLEALRGLRAHSFPKEQNLAAFGLTRPAYKFQVEFGDKNQKQIVEAAKVGDHIYARRTTDPLPSELEKTALDNIDKALSEL